MFSFVPRLQLTEMPMVYPLPSYGCKWVKKMVFPFPLGVYFPFLGPNPKDCEEEGKLDIFYCEQTPEDENPSNKKIIVYGEKCYKKRFLDNMNIETREKNSIF